MIDYVKEFRKITEEMGDLYEKKNTAYGNSFAESYEEFGLISSIVRLSDKFKRLKSLHKNPNIDDIGESIDDTIKDMACYCIMTMIERKLEKGREKKDKAARKYIRYVPEKPKAASCENPNCKCKTPCGDNCKCKSSGDEMNMFSGVIETDYNFQECELHNINPKYVLRTIIDGKAVENVCRYEFEHPGKHTVEVHFLKDLPNVDSMFFECSDYLSIDVSMMKTEKLTGLPSMFENCYNLRDIEGLDALNYGTVNNLYSTFCGCVNLNEMDLSFLDLSSVKIAEELFSDCFSLMKVTLKNVFPSDCSLFRIFDTNFNDTEVHIQSDSDISHIKNECSDNITFFRDKVD